VPYYCQRGKKGNGKKGNRLKEVQFTSFGEGMICIPEGQCPSFLNPALSSTLFASLGGILF
jgi:hypothetical protein